MEQHEVHAEPGLRLARMGHLETSRQVPLNHPPGRDSHDILYAVSVPSVVYGMFRLAGRTIRWLFRVRFQARL